MSTRYTPNRLFEGELLRSTSVVPMLRDFTTDVAARAREHAATRSRTIAASIEGDVGITATGEIRGRVNAFDFKSGWAEFGTSRFPQVRMLGRAVEEIVGPVRGD